ncbi:MAG TPA: hypothetical protein DCS93_31880 [Microscillaceae bacterium]|nr:hypothetical protein [Microscillaceae bacterium]
MKTVDIKNHQLLDLDTTIGLIKSGKTLVVSGDEQVLSKLPAGNWIGGTIPYFYLKEGPGRLDKEHIFVTDFTDALVDAKVATYNVNNLQKVGENGFDNGFHFLILPALRDIHLSFALNAPDYSNIYTNPLLGFIAGADLDEFTTGSLSKVYNGQTAQAFTDEAVVLHAKLPARQVARLEIVNVFEPSNEISLEVFQDGFTVQDCLIDGQRRNLYEFVKENALDVSYPLVSNYGGASVNVSFQRLDDENQQVIFYAPLFAGRKYTLSKKTDDYVKAFADKAIQALAEEQHIIYNCNCILNYLYGKLDQHSIGYSGAATFGEIGYQLLNQTFTYLAIDES